MTPIRVLVTLLFLICLGGCQTTQPKPKIEAQDQIVSALGTVTEGLTNQNISQKDLKNLAVSAQKDPEVKSALSSINQALKAHQTGVKYCPVDGQRFDASLDICPVHKVKLKELE